MYSLFPFLILILLINFSFAEPVMRGDVLLPDGSMNDLIKTPGDVRTTSKHTICTQKTKTIRSVSKKVHKQAFTLYGLTNKTGWCKKEGCEVDHLISLELGGSNDIKNLWPQPYAGEWNAHLKDALENRLHKLICNGTVTPEGAQYAISHDWISAYKQYIEGPADTEQDK